MEAQGALHKERADYHAHTARVRLNTALRLKDTLALVMQRTAQKKLAGEEFEAGLRSSESVEVTDEVAVPGEFKRTPPPPAPVPDKPLIKAALKAGQEVPGAVLVTRPYVVLK